MHPDILTFAKQHDADPTTVDFMVGHIMRELGDSMLAEENQAAQIELMRAGVESSQQAMRSLAINAMTQCVEFGKVVYDIVEARA